MTAASSIGGTGLVTWICKPARRVPSLSFGLPRFRAAQRQPKRERRATPRALAGRRQGSPVEIRKMARYGESQAKLPAGAIALLGARLRPVREAVEQVGQDVGGDPYALVPH